MINFQCLRFKNFSGYGNMLTEIRLDSYHTNVLVGESGSGKSSVAAAISFALYGKTLAPILKNEIVNDINGGDCLVEIEFVVGSKQYKVRRGIKPTIFEIYCNGALINQDSHSKDYQAHLEKAILGMTFKTFAQVVVLSAVNFSPFMQLKANERRSLIEDLLDIQVFSVMSSFLKESISTNKLAIEANVGEIQAHKDKIAFYKSYLEDLKKGKQDLIDSNNKLIEDNNASIVTLESTIADNNKRIEECKELIEDEQKIVEKLNTYLNYQRDIDSNLKRVKKELKFYEDNVNCPTCEREFESSYRQDIITKQKAKETEFVTASDKIKAALSKVQQRKLEIEKVKTSIETLKSKNREKTYGISSCKTYIMKLLTENNKLKVQQSKPVEEDKLTSLTEQLKKSEEERTSLAKDKYLNDLATTVLKDSGIKAKIIKQYIPIINKLVTRFLHFMNFYISFEIDENFNDCIKANGTERTYYTYSDGQRQRLDIAILLTWRTIATMKNSIKTNLLFIDELLDSNLDPVAADNIIEMVREEPILKNSNIFIVTHKTQLADKFDNCLKFELDKNFCRLSSNSTV